VVFAKVFGGVLNLPPHFLHRVETQYKDFCLARFPFVKCQPR
jgi:hypothetical protein